MFGFFLLLTYYFQAVRHFSPLRTGLAFLPMSAAALLNTIAASASAAFALAYGPQPRAAALAHGYAVAAQYGCAILTMAAIIAAVSVNAGKPSAGMPRS